MPRSTRVHREPARESDAQEHRPGALDKDNLSEYPFKPPDVVIVDPPPPAYLISGAGGAAENTRSNAARSALGRSDTAT